MRKIILASASPRRKELLRMLGLKFSVDAGSSEEHMNGDINPRKLARQLSFEKAGSVAWKYRDAIIIAADTFILFRNKLLGKPKDRKDARGMLSMLNGKSHSVITGFTVIDTATGKWISRSVETKVFFRRLKPAEIESYARSGEPMGKAGAYAIQGSGSAMIKRIEGDYFNVIGLPLASLRKCLKVFGVCVL